MTKEEAAEILQEQIDKYGQEYDDEGIEALEFAIRSLQAWNKVSRCIDFYNMRELMPKLSGFDCLVIDMLNELDDAGGKNE